MHTLSETQALLMHALRHGDDGGRAAALLRPRTAIAPERRLQVYRNNLRASLGAALRAVYPVLARLVGDAFFRQLVHGFLAAHPSRAGHLHPFGRELPAFLRSLPAAAGWPWLADVARLEWAWHEAYHGADGARLDPAALGAVPPAAHERLRLHLQPSARFVASPYPILAIWQAHQDGADPDAPPVSLEAGAEHVLVARRGFDVVPSRLGDAEACWLRALGAGAVLGTALAAALEFDPCFDLGIALVRHLDLGTFRAVSVGAQATP